MPSWRIYAPFNRTFEVLKAPMVVRDAGYVHAFNRTFEVLKEVEREILKSGARAP